MKGKSKKKSDLKSNKDNDVAEPEGTDESDQKNEDIELTVEEQLELSVKKSEENWDRYLRAAAELDNVRKRASRDVENARKFALENFSRELLNVVDTLEMAIDSKESDLDALLSGNKATLQLMQNIMEQFDISVIDPHGEPFNAEFHEAMSMQPSDKVEPGSIMTVFQKGYLLNNRLLRPARVVVASDVKKDG
ncbi:MAG: nucleotide exchange factor GrpE [Pseudomonadota bacterium]|nr:nucleotide exchange factor GrpE [Pseudomonadota bacterium]